MLGERILCSGLVDFEAGNFGLFLSMLLKDGVVKLVDGDRRLVSSRTVDTWYLLDCCLIFLSSWFGFGILGNWKSHLPVV